MAMFNYKLIVLEGLISDVTFLKRTVLGFYSLAREKTMFGSPHDHLVVRLCEQGLSALFSACKN